MYIFANIQNRDMVIVDMINENLQEKGREIIIVLKFIKEKILGANDKNKKISEDGSDEKTQLNKMELTSLNIEKAFEELDKGEMAPPDSWHIVLLNNLHERECDNVDLSIIKNKELNNSSNKLEGREILFLDYINGWDYNSKNFPKYWTFKYRLPLQKTIEKLHKNNLIQKGDLKSSLNKLTVKEIQEILREKKLKISGKKSELIDRLLKGVDEDDLIQLSLPNVVGLTKEGKNIIEQNKHLFLNVGLDLNQIEYAYEKGITDFHEYAINIYQEERKENLKNYEYGFARNNLLNISNIYKDKKDKENQLKYLIKVFAEDIFEDILREYYLKKKLPDMGEEVYNNLFSEQHNQVIIAPGIINPLKKLSKKLDLSDLEIEQIIFDHINSLPVGISKNQFKDRMKLIKNNIDKIGGSIKTR